MWGDSIGGDMVVPQHRTTVVGEKDAVCMVDYAQGRRGNKGGRSCTSKKQLRYSRSPKADWALF